MKLAMFLLMTVAFANKNVVAKPVKGVTVEQVRDAQKPINVATFQHKDKTYGVKCAGAEDKMRCQIWSKADNAMVIANDKLKIC